MGTPYRGRVRTGCLACRVAKVKCDEQQPVCKRCLRRQQDCLYTKKRKQVDTVQSTAESVDESRPSTPVTADPFLSPRTTPQQQSPSASVRSPSLLSTLVSQDILLCTTIDYIAATEDRPSYIYFQQHFESPFITPYDPANWSVFKEQVLELTKYSRCVAEATAAVQAVHRTRKNHLSQAQALKLYNAAYDTLLADLASENDIRYGVDRLFTATFLLSMVEMMLPGETSPGLLYQANNALITGLGDPPSLSAAPCLGLHARLSSWLLICHAAARRSGNRGLLSPHVQDLFKVKFTQRGLLPALESSADPRPDQTLLTSLTEPLFATFVHTQIISAEIADLSHYHRSRTTGQDQEEVTLLMSALQSRLDSLWTNRPALLNRRIGELSSAFTSREVAAPLDLLCTLCTLVFDIEMVEMGRNLSQEQSTTAEALDRLKQMQSTISDWIRRNPDAPIPPAFLRALLLSAIESPDPGDVQWAVGLMRKIQDPICYSEFFANFSEGLADVQRVKSRRVTTRWFGLQTFGVLLPFL